MLQKIAPYNKFVVAVVGALITWGYVVVTSEPTAITSLEWVGLAGGVGTALGVYAAPNQGVK